MTGRAMLLSAALFISANALHAQAESLDPLAFLTMRAKGETALPSTSIPHDVEIDQTIQVDWDEPRFFAAVATGVRSAPGEPLTARIELLTRVLTDFVEGQAAMLELRAIASRRAAARLRGDSTAFQAEFDAAAERSGKALSSSLKTIQNLADEPAFAGAEDEAQRLLGAVDVALLADDYGPVANVLQDALADLSRQLLERTAAGDSILVYMTAWLHSGGIRRQLHLEGYDDFLADTPTPFPRVRFSVDERTRRELEGAAALRDRIESLPRLGQQVHEAGQAFRDAIRGLSEKGELTETNELLQQFLAELKQLDADKQIQDAVALARREVEAVIAFAPLRDAGEGDVAALVGFATAFDGAVQSLRGAVTRAVDRLRALHADVRAKPPATTKVPVADVLARLDATTKALGEDSAVRALFGDLESTARQLGLIQGVVAGVGQVGSIGRRIGPHASLDTSLDLLGAGERHPGDFLVISVQVTRLGADKPQVLAAARQTFRLRALGFYLEPRGALLFVDPRRSGLGDQSFEPVIGLSYVGHIGLRNAGFWNDILNPGLGITLALLDFEDGRDLEVGLGGSLTLLRDLLFVGYGRNIQVKADYFTIGLNPLAFGDLARMSRTTVAAE